MCWWFRGRWLTRSSPRWQQSSPKAKANGCKPKVAPPRETYLELGVAYLGRFAEEAVTLPQTLYRALTNAEETVNLKVVGRNGEARLTIGRHHGRA